ncbi:MAG: hypothetical protein Ct9H90mP28_1780 [Paracoccaceae bacterium]|nr:MAG: hypothetical protein Ct9H90mP28_1780 [Paracoccaceae bacterium]
MEDTSSSNTTVSHIYVNLEQISFYEENQETENWPIYKLEISNFWKKIRDDNPTKTELIDEYENKYIEYIKIWDYSPLSSYLLYMGEIIPIPNKDFSTAILQLFSHFAITIISAKEIERLSREPYYSNKPYFCKLTFSSRKIEGNNVKFLFDEYSDIFAAKEIIQSTVLANYWNDDSSCSYIILTKKTENDSNTELNVLFPLNLIYEYIPEIDPEHVSPNLYGESPSIAETLIDLGFIISNNEIERSGHEFNREDPIAATILLNTDPEENIEWKEETVISEEFLLDDSDYMTQQQIEEQGSSVQEQIEEQGSSVQEQIEEQGSSVPKEPFGTPQSSHSRASVSSPLLAISESPHAKASTSTILETNINMKTLGKVNRALNLPKSKDASPYKTNPNNNVSLSKYMENADRLQNDTNRVNIIRKIYTQADNEKRVTDVFKNAERCPNNIKYVSIKKARGGNTYMETSIVGDSGKKKKIIKIIFERYKESDIEWITLRTYLYRLFISDTLHDFYDKGSTRLSSLIEPRNNANFLRFYQNYMQKFINIFPEILKYDNDGIYRERLEQNFNNLQTIVQDNNLEKVEKALGDLIKKTYKKFFQDDLKRENKSHLEFNQTMEILEQHEIKTRGGYFAKPMVTDADNKALKYFAILNEYYEQKQNASKALSYEAKAPLIYLKTLSHELDQATTPKIERVLKSINLDYFDRGTVTRLASVTLATNRYCRNLKRNEGLSKVSQSVAPKDSSKKRNRSQRSDMDREGLDTPRKTLDMDRELPRAARERDERRKAADDESQMLNWTRYVDEASGKPYWYNSTTKETTWDDPTTSKKQPSSKKQKSKDDDFVIPPVRQSYKENPSGGGDGFNLEMWGGEQGITDNLYSVQIQMIRRDIINSSQKKDTTFLDYEIHRNLKNTNNIITLKEQSLFCLGLMHVFSKHAIMISLKDNVGNEKIKVQKDSKQIRVRPPIQRTLRTTNKVCTSQTVGSVKTSWWGTSIDKRCFIKEDSKKTISKSAAAFVLECIEFCREIKELAIINDNTMPISSVMESIIKLMFHSDNKANYRFWIDGIINRITTYIDYWWDDDTKIQNKSFCNRMLNKISQIQLVHIDDKESAIQNIIKLHFLLGNQEGSDWDGHYIKFCKTHGLIIDKIEENNYKLINYDGDDDISIDVKINNILGTTYNAPGWFQNMRTDISNLYAGSSNNKDVEDESGSSFGVSKLTKWMFHPNVQHIMPKTYDTTYERLEKPVILKMMMDSFHYINLLENKLQVENRKASTIGRKVLPILHTMDLNCGYLCGFFTDQILSSIEYNKDFDSVVSPKTIVNKKNIEKIKIYMDNANQTANSIANQQQGRATDLGRHGVNEYGVETRRTGFFGETSKGGSKYGSGKTRRRGDKIKSNGKITRRKSI